MHPGVTPLVEVNDLHVHFGEARAVDGASLKVLPGEVLALVGESGSGKTTLIRAIQGLQKPTSGNVTVEGKVQTIFHDPRVQMVFQDPTGALNPRQTIYEIVAEGLRIQHKAGNERELVALALSRAGLRPPERFFTLFPHEISGGQRQRVVIAGAMVMEPRLLLADEPVASLDASIRGEILALMRQLVDDTGLAILVVTHDLGLAWNIADRVAVMYLGRIVETGLTEEILESPKHPYTQALLSVVPETKEMTPQILVGEIPDLSRMPSGCRFHPRCPLFQSGTLALEVSARCEGSDPGPVPLDAVTHAACWAAIPGPPARDILTVA
jgi:oligopeptide/dipeptide ABC transporter ATP-binding protein